MQVSVEHEQKHVALNMFAALLSQVALRTLALTQHRGRIITLPGTFTECITGADPGGCLPTAMDRPTGRRTTVPCYILSIAEWSVACLNGPSLFVKHHLGPIALTGLAGMIR